MYIYIYIYIYVYTKHNNNDNDSNIVVPVGGPAVRPPAGRPAISYY